MKVCRVPTTGGSGQPSRPAEPAAGSAVVAVGGLVESPAWSGRRGRAAGGRPAGGRARRRGRSRPPRTARGGATKSVTSPAIMGCRQRGVRVGGSVAFDGRSLLQHTRGAENFTAEPRAARTTESSMGKDVSGPGRGLETLPSPAAADKATTPPARWERPAWRCGLGRRRGHLRRPEPHGGGAGLRRRQRGAAARRRDTGGLVPGGALATARSRRDRPAAAHPRRRADPLHGGRAGATAAASGHRHGVVPVRAAGGAQEPVRPHRHLTASCRSAPRVGQSLYDRTTQQPAPGRGAGRRLGTAWASADRASRPARSAGPASDLATRRPGHGRVVVVSGSTAAGESARLPAAGSLGLQAPRGVVRRGVSAADSRSVCRCWRAARAGGMGRLPLRRHGGGPAPAFGSGRSAAAGMRRRPRRPRRGVRRRGPTCRRQATGRATRRAPPPHPGRSSRVRSSARRREGDFRPSGN